MRSIRRIMPCLWSCIAGILPVIALSVAVVRPASAANMTLQWTAPGDDGNVGRATRYEIRYSPVRITVANYAQATAVIGVPVPMGAGTHESLNITGLPAGTLFLALRTVDEAGNWSAISNIATPPGQITGGADEMTVSFSTAWPNPAKASSTVSYSLREAGSVQVDVYDAMGRHIKTLATGWHAAGRGEIVWDLRGDSGQRVEAGIYMMRARLADQTWVRRLAVIG